MSLLTEFFHRADEDQSGHLSLDELSKALAQLPCCAPAKMDTAKLIQVGEYIDIVGNGKINYLEFLNAFHVEDSSGPQLEEDILEYIYRILHFTLEQPLRRSFRVEDPDNIGQITKSQFERCLNATIATRNPPDLTKGQLKCLADTLSLQTPPDAPEGAEPLLDYEDWLNSFEIVDTVLDEEH